VINPPHSVLFIRKVNVAIAKLLLAKQGYSEKIEINEEKKLLVLSEEEEV
jgi:hypothetical protein